MLPKKPSQRACARRRQYLTVACAIATLWCGVVCAASKSGSTPQTYTFLFENDLFGDSDAQYTNGLKVSWLSGDLHRIESRPGVPPWLLGLVERLNAFERRVVDDDDRQFNFGFAVGQAMFTPDDIATSALVPDDRPYAGWLYGALTFVSKSRNIADTLEFQGGVIGPASLAKQAQNLVHDIRDIPRARLEQAARHRTGLRAFLRTQMATAARRAHRRSRLRFHHACRGRARQCL